MHVLIAEDDFDVRHALARLLSPVGEVSLATDGREALDAVGQALARAERFDLVLLDIGMPAISGLQLLPAIRELEAEHGLAVGQGAKVVMITGRSDRWSIMSSFSASCEGYIVKPFRTRQLWATLADLGFSVPG